MSCPPRFPLGFVIYWFHTKLSPSHFTTKLRSWFSRFQTVYLCCPPSELHISLLNCYSTRHSRSLMFFQQLWTALSQRWVCFTSLFLCEALYFLSCELCWRSTEHGRPQGRKNGRFPPLEIWTNNQKFLWKIEASS